MNQVSLKAIAAMAAGCTMVLKPSEIAPLSSLVFADMVHEAGIPAGVFNMAGTVLATTQAFSDLQHNSSLEALAIGADGALYTLPERSGLATRPFPVYRLQDSVWDIPFHIPRRGAFLISGADIGPDGLFYVLERDFVGVGFRSRVRRFALDGTDEELILQTGVRTHDNLEGISVWQGASGLRMTLISDDNFRGFQQTQIVEYRLTD